VASPSVIELHHKSGLGPQGMSGYKKKKQQKQEHIQYNVEQYTAEQRGHVTV
jgi:hypothetical protein